MTKRKPKRIQRRRTKGWRWPDGAILVGRPTKWGNPWRVGIDGNAGDCVLKYARLVLIENVWSEPNVMQIQRELRGQDLLCWCPLSRLCHADVLIAIANAPSYLEGCALTEYVCRKLKLTRTDLDRLA